MPPGRSIRAPWLWIAIAGLHVVAAVYAWRLLPHGFAWQHPRFWTNEVMPVALVATAAACVVGLWRNRPRIASLAIAVFPGLHAGMAAAWLIVFPLTGGRPATVGAVITAVLVACTFASLRSTTGTRSSIAIGALLGLGLGWTVSWSQRGPAPATHPAEQPHALARPTDAPSPALPPWLHVLPEASAVRIDAGSIQIDLQPLLTFYSRSPDRGWTMLATQQQRIGPPRRYAGTVGDTASYAGDEPATLMVTSAGDSAHLDAETLLPKEVYSHLNAFCAIEITGHHHLFLAFSPMPAQRIEVTYSEYPVGKPSRFAYVDAHRVLHVVQSTSGEKGPFTELAHGPISADGVLGITLFDDDRAVATLELADYESQASTQASPTAGWGVPENAIEFSLGSDQHEAPAAIFITLAGTSVGRGWDSVGHAPGVYRNRIDVRR